MLNLSSRCILGLALALACASPAMAQQGPDPLTRFLDGVFKRPTAPAAPPAPAQPAQPQTTPAPRAAPPAKADARKTAPKKTAAPKPQLIPQAAPEPVTAAKPEPSQESQARPTEPETTRVEPAAPKPAPTIEELSAQAAENTKSEAQTEKPQPEKPAPVAAAEPPKPVKETPREVAPAPTPVAAPAPVRAPAAPPLPASPAAALDRVNDYFNSIDRLSAYFVQKNPNGQQAEGTLSLQRPGRLHFAYAPPSSLEIVSDGRNVAIRDKQLGTNDVYPIGQTPLKFLLQENVDLARDVKVRDVQIGRDGMVTVQFDDKATLGGTSKITLRFDARANALKQWTIIDAQGYETSVTLSGLNVVRQNDASVSN